MVKSPPFPDQPVQVTTESTDAKASDTQAGASNDAEDKDVVRDKPDDTIDPNATLQPINPGNNSSSNADKINDANEAVAENTTATKTPTSTQSKDQLSQKKTVAAKVKNTKLETKSMSATSFAMQMKKSAWAIQIGSFKSKANALRLVNRLRSGGYHAFIKEASTSVRVYVGPENKRAIASMLADRIEYEMKLHGVVVSYQPLTL